MSEASSGASPIERATDSVGNNVIEAFSLLGNEIRLAILMALWEAYEPFAGDTAVSHNELQDRLGIDDGDHLNYHVTKLQGRYLRRTDTGYVLRQRGHKVIQTVIAGVGVTRPEFPETPTDVDCILCGGQTVLSHDDGAIYLRCTECAGLHESESMPDGVIAGGAFDAAALANRSAEEIFTVSLLTTRKAFELAFSGICNECRGHMDGSLLLCDDHPLQGLCDSCGMTHPYQARYRCLECKNDHLGPATAVAASHPVFTAFLVEQGVYPLGGRPDTGFLEVVIEHITDSEENLISDDPPTVEVTIDHDGAVLQMIIDKDLQVTEVEW